jgi:hypothetical protein
LARAKFECGMKKASCGFLVIFPAAVAFLLFLHQTVYHEFNPQLKGGEGGGRGGKGDQFTVLCNLKQYCFLKSCLASRTRYKYMYKLNCQGYGWLSREMGG